MRSTAIVPSAIALALIPVALFALSACEACTLIGCDSGLEVRFSSAISASTTVTAFSEADGERTVTCASSAPCTEVFFKNFTPSDVTVTVDLPSGSRTLNFAPEYSTFRPNGESCDPACRTAEIEMTL